MPTLGLLLATGDSVKQAMARVSERVGLSPLQARAIIALESHGASTQRSLALACATTPRNVTALVDALSARGLVTRAAHPRDRRSVLVTLTPEGHGLATRVEEEFRSVSRRALAALEPDGIAALSHALEAIGAQLAASSGEARPPGGD